MVHYVALAAVLWPQARPKLDLRCKASADTSDKSNLKAVKDAMIPDKTEVQGAPKGIEVRAY